MHLRRALLLFAIVLGLAAVAASVSRPPEETRESARRDPPPASETDRTPPTVSPGRADPSEPPAELTFDAAGERTLRLEAERPATVLVEVDEPGAVEIAELGLDSPATPLAPARFELFVSDPGRYRISFTPAAGDDERSAGTLVVTAAGR